MKGDARHKEDEIALSPRKQKWAKWWPHTGSETEPKRKLARGASKRVFYISVTLGLFFLLLLSFWSPYGSQQRSTPSAPHLVSDHSNGNIRNVKNASELQEPLPPRDDTELFVRALDVAASESSQKKIAFLFITRGPLPLAPLWARFFRGHADKFSIYIHASPNYTAEPSSLPPLFRGRHIPSKPVQWGTVGLLNAERRLLASALLDPGNAHMVVLSESCIPLFNFSYVYDYITSSPHSFVTVTKCPYENKTWSPTLLPEVPKAIWRKGDGWKEVHRDLAVTILTDKYYLPKFEQYYGCPKCHRPMQKGVIDERYIPTLLHAVRGQDLANRTLVWVDWASNAKRYHPPTYRYANVTKALLSSLRCKTTYYPFADTTAEAIPCTLRGKLAPCYLFARKFAPGTLKRLQYLAKEMLKY